ncbi:antibiotic biosynthesis monooxygenase family protein [Permianibacter aggregans]|nr:antibiotic biosynthesis monooxygenase [Permianibacter aggregans]QGX40000.1 antibiotic biosynthesis monooxygenase [Permianibacter aggregans]
MPITSKQNEAGSYLNPADLVGAYAVIFLSKRTEIDAGYGQAADRMVELAAQQPGYIGVRSVREPGGLGVTISYWRSEADIKAWRQHLEHAATRETGRKQWYQYYELQVCKIERAYDFGLD